jgi:D-serine dehydratase
VTAEGPLDLTWVLDDVVDGRMKAYPPSASPLPVHAVGMQGWKALEGDLLLPVMVLREDALAHNIELMASYCAEHSVSLAPHVKTPLSPQIAQRQLRAGAWGLTVANVHQALVLRRAGARRLLMANELVEAAAITWVARELHVDPSFEFTCLVDSVAGAAALEAHLTAAGLPVRVAVLIELGIPAARCGCRTVDDAVHLAAALRGMPHLRLAGVETYENMFPSAEPSEMVRSVDRLLDDLWDLTSRLDQAGHFEQCEEILVSAGGSMWFDRVVARLGNRAALSRPVRTVIRAGSYVTHDAVQYERLSPLAGRSADARRLRQALELWATVLSRPDPDLAILGFGKRDAAHDRGFPIPFATRTAAGVQPLTDPEYEVLSLNDQHARLRVPPASLLGVGDLVGSYVSHPCTSFDNWRLIPVVDDQYVVIDAVRSYL